MRSPCVVWFRRAPAPGIKQLVAGLAFLTVLSCGSPKGGAAPIETALDWGAFADSLPTLVTVLEAESPAPVNVQPRSYLAIDTAGTVLAPTDRSGHHVLAAIDTSGRVILTFGSAGPGPGEMKWSTPIGFDAGGFAAYDMAQMKMVLFDSTGAHREDVRPHDAGLVVARSLLDDSTALVVVPDPQGGSLPGAMSLVSGEIATLIPAADSFIATFRGTPDQQMKFTPGRWLGGIVVANAMTYDLAFYNWQGELLRVVNHQATRPRLTAREADKTLASLSSAPGRRPLTGADLERARDRLMNETRPFFSHLATPTIDDQGRLWILGEAGDSGYADVFGRDGFLGRVALSCNGFKSTWALTGHWLALTCAPRDSASTAAGVLKILRIEG